MATSKFIIRPTNDVQLEQQPVPVEEFYQNTVDQLNTYSEFSKEEELKNNDSENFRNSFFWNTLI